MNQTDQPGKQYVCPTCGSSEFEDLPGDAESVLCTNCGLHFKRSALEGTSESALDLGRRAVHFLREKFKF